MTTPVVPPTELATLDALLLACAGATVACARCDEGRSIEMDMAEMPITCQDCGGTGRVYFFPNEVRLACINNRDDGTWCRSHPSCAGSCQGQGWVPNPSSDAWREALRILELTISITAVPKLPGDAVRIWRGGSSDQGIVPAVERLRGQLGEMTAVYRMLEQIPGVEMPNA